MFYLLVMYDRFYLLSVKYLLDLLELIYYDY